MRWTLQHPGMTALGDLGRAGIAELHARELARFREARSRALVMIGGRVRTCATAPPMAWMASDNNQPVYIDHGRGPGFTDADGFAYLDFNSSDMAMFSGHAPSRDRGRGAGTSGAVHAVPAVDQGGGGGGRGTGPPLSRPAVAVHVVGRPGQHRGYQAVAGDHRARGGRAVPGALPQPLRGGPGGPGRRPGHRGAVRLVQGRHRTGADRPVRRPGHAAGSAGTRRRGAGLDGAAHDQHHPPAAARARLARGAV